MVDLRNLKVGANVISRTGQTLRAPTEEERKQMERRRTKLELPSILKDSVFDIPEEQQLLPTGSTQLLRRAVNKITPGFDLFKPKSDAQVREEARTERMIDTGQLSSLKVRTPLGRAEDATAFPTTGAGKVKAFTRENVNFILEAVPSTLVELSQVGRDLKNLGEGEPLDVPFDATRIGEPTEDFQGVARRFLNTWDTLDEEQSGDTMKNGISAFTREVVPTMFDVVIAGDIAKLGTKAILRGTKPELDVALNKLGYTRKTFNNTTRSQFKDDTVALLDELISKGDVAAYQDAINSLRVVGKETAQIGESIDVLELNAFGESLQALSLKLNSSISDIVSASARPLGNLKVGLPGTRPRPGQFRFGLSAEELENVGGRQLFNKAKKADDLASFRKSITPAEKDTIEAAGFALGDFLSKAKEATPAIPQDLQPLIQEARKYKSAEEFVEAVKLRGEANGGSIVRIDKSVPIEDIKLNPQSLGNAERNVKQGAVSKTDRKPSVFFDVEKREFSLSDGYHRFVKLRDSGAKNIEVEVAFGKRNSPTETPFLTTRKTDYVTATKSQLTDLWNKAQGGEVRPPSAERVLGKTKPDKVARREDILLRERLRAEKRGADLGAKSQKEIARQEAREIKKVEREKAQQTAQTIRKNKDAKLKEYKENLKNRQAEALELVDKLPKSVQGRFKKAITEATTSKRVLKLRERVKRNITKYLEREELKEAKNLVKTAKTASITPKYQRLIDDLVKEYDFAKPTDKTISRLKATREFLERNPDYPIPEKYIDEIKRLEKVNLKEADLGQIKQFNKTIGGLLRLGQEIQKHKTIVNKLRFERELDKAIQSVVNRDMQSDKLNKAIEAEDAMQFTFRVADKTDGNVLYKGWHAQFVKKIGQKVNEAEINQSNRMFQFFQEHTAISETTLGEVEQKQVAAHLYKNQGGDEQAAKILEQLGVEEMPVLTPEQEQIKDLLVKIAKEKTDDIQPLWESTMKDDNGRPMAFDVQDEYFPFYYEEQFSDIGVFSILQDYKIQSRVRFGSGFGRQKGVDLTPRTDVYKMLQEAIAKQEIFLNIQPELFEKGTIFRTQKYQDAAGDLNSKYWVGYIDEISKNGMSSNAVRTPIDGLLRKGRMNISRGLLDLSFSSAAIQPMAIFDAMGYMVTYLPKKTVFKLAGNFIQMFVRPNFARNTVEKSLALQTRRGGEEVISAFNLDKIKKGQKLPTKTWQKVVKKIKSPFALLQFFDLKTAAAVQKTMRSELVKSLPEDVANAEADFIMDLLSGSSNVGYRPRIMNQGELGRALTTFQTFVLNEWGILTQDILRKGIVKGGPNKSWMTRFWALLGLGFLFLQGYLEDKLRTNITNAVRDTDYEDNSFLKSSLLYIPERIPILGNIVRGVEYGKEGISVPIADIFSSIISEGYGVVTAKETKTKLKNLSKAIESVAIVFFGTPGAKESQNIIERLIEESSIGEETAQDIAQDILERIQSGEMSVEVGKEAFQNRIASLESSQKRERFKLPPKEYAQDLLERMRNEEITIEEAKEEFADFMDNIPEPDEKVEDGELNFFDSFILAMKGLPVDSANVAKAVFTKEKLAEVEGNLVALQRDKGEKYFNEDGSLNPKGGYYMKLEMMEELGLTESQMPDFRREHIVPVKAGGDNSDDNQQIIEKELHESYTPLDIEMGRAVRSGEITRKDAEEIMTALKVKNEITIEEAFNRLENLRQEG